MTQTDLQQDALQDLVSEKGTEGGGVGRSGDRRCETVLPPIDSSPTPTTAGGRGNPSTACTHHSSSNAEACFSSVSPSYAPISFVFFSVRLPLTTSSTSLCSASSAT